MNATQQQPNPFTNGTEPEQQLELFMPEPEPIPDWERALQMSEALGLGATAHHLVYTTIFGAPWSKSRPRFARNGHTYTKPEDRNAEVRTGKALKRAVPEPFTGNVGLACVFFRPNRQRIDADNLLKHVCDAGNGILWLDDSQCTAIMGMVELDAENPRTLVIVGEHASTLTRGTDATYPCVVCDKPISVMGQTGHRKLTCSRECTQIKRGYASLADFVPCPQCGKEFRRRSSYSKLCSPECRVASFRNKRKSHAMPFSRCSTCGTELTHHRGGRCRDCWRADPSGTGVNREGAQT